MTKKEVLIVAIITLITIIAWVIFDILHARAQVQLPPNLEQLSEPLDPNFDITGVQNE